MTPQCGPVSPPGGLALPPSFDLRVSLVTRGHAAYGALEGREAREGQIARSQLEGEVAAAAVRRT